MTQRDCFEQMELNNENHLKGYYEESNDNAKAKPFFVETEEDIYSDIDLDIMETNTINILDLI